MLAEPGGGQAAMGRALGTLLIAAVAASVLLLAVTAWMGWRVFFRADDVRRRGAMAMFAGASGVAAAFTVFGGMEAWPVTILPAAVAFRAAWLAARDD